MTSFSRPSLICHGLAALLALLASLAFPAGVQAQDPCIVNDNGTGTVTLPPEGCEYLSPAQVHMIIDGLPPGTTIIFKPIHRDFICRQLGGCGQGGGKGNGTLGGEVETAQTNLVFHLSGTGVLSGFERDLKVPMRMETHTAPRVPGAPVQDFETAIFDLEGEITGDPDFAFLRITAGEAHGLPSPGHTTLTRLNDGTFLVESIFNVAYRIQFEGDPNGGLRGFGGASKGTVRMEAFDID